MVGLADTKRPNANRMLWTVWTLALAVALVPIALSIPQVAASLSVFPLVLISLASATFVWLHTGTDAAQPVCVPRRPLELSVALASSVLLVALFGLSSTASPTAPLFALIDALTQPAAAVAVFCWALLALDALAPHRASHGRATRRPFLFIVLGALWFAATVLAGAAADRFAPLPYEAYLLCAVGGALAFFLAACSPQHNTRTSTASPATDPVSPAARNQKAECYAAILRAHEKSRLSDRELAVLVRVAEGKTGRDIAHELNLTTATVGSYRTRGYAKLGVRKKSELMELVARSIEQGEAACSATPATSTSPYREAPHTAGATTCLPGKRATAAELAIALILLLASKLTSAFWHPRPDASTMDAPTFPIPAVCCALLIGSARAATRAKHPADRQAHDTDQNLSTSVAFTACAGITASALLLGDPAILGGTNILWSALGLVATTALLGSRTQEAPTAHKGVRTLVSTLRAGWTVRATRCPELIALFATVAIAAGTTPYNAATTFGASEAFPLARELCIVAIAALAWCAATQLVASSQRIDASEPDLDRMAAYLKGRGLTDLQTRVILLSLRGKTAPDIAAQLSIAPGTVRAYRSHAYALLGVRTLRDVGELLSRDVKTAERSR